MNQRIISKQTQVITHASRPNYYTAAKSVNIAPNFYGYIRGIQYFRNLQISKEPRYFAEKSSSNSSLLFYYKFDKENAKQASEGAN
jgi:hypothetical protein